MYNKESKKIGLPKMGQVFFPPNIFIVVKAKYS